MKCVYCSKPLPAGRESCHVECMHELLCRRDARRCIGCGKADVVDGSVRCAECVESERFGYGGYPGGGGRGMKCRFCEDAHSMNAHDACSDEYGRLFAG